MHDMYWYTFIQLEEANDVHSNSWRCMTYLDAM